jgi:hypothetical protein
LPALSERCSFVDVNRDDAQELAARLQAEDADRMTHQFLPRDNLDGSWSVAKVLIPEELRNSAQPTTTEVRPSWPNLDDGRGGLESGLVG